MDCFPLHDIVERGDTHENVDYPANHAHRAEYRGDQVEAENPDQAPVQASDHEQHGSDDVNGKSGSIRAWLRMHLGDEQHPQVSWRI